MSTGPERGSANKRAGPVATSGTTRVEFWFASFVGVCAIGVALVAFAEAERRNDSPTSPLTAVAAANSVAAARGLSLRGTIVVSDARYSEALVDLGGGDLHRVRPGAALGQYGTLVAVQTKSILIRRDGRVFEFTFNDSALGGSGTFVAGADGGIADAAAGSAETATQDTTSGPVWAEVDTGPPKQIEVWKYNDE